MATIRTYTSRDGRIITFKKNHTILSADGNIIAERLITVATTGFQAAWAAQATITMGFK